MQGRDPVQRDPEVVWEPERDKRWWYIKQQKNLVPGSIFDKISISTSRTLLLVSEMFEEGLFFQFFLSRPSVHMGSGAFSSSEGFCFTSSFRRESKKRASVYRVGVYPFVLWHSNEIHCCLKNNEGKMQVNSSRQFLCFVGTDEALDAGLWSPLLPFTSVWLMIPAGFFHKSFRFCHLKANKKSSSHIPRRIL